MLSGPSRGDIVRACLLLALAITAVEYLARRGLAPWLPVVSARVVNDQLCSAAAYLLLVFGVARGRGVSLRGQLRRLANVAVRFPRQQDFWVAVAWCGACAALLVPLDRWLWGQVRLPGWEAPGNPTRWLAQAGPVLAPLSLLVVNGLVVPVAEEFLWRGVIQRRLSRVLGPWPAIILTAVLFSLKHAVVDASLGRLLFITGLGTVWGHVAHRRRWHASAVVHAAMNLLATLLFVLGMLWHLLQRPPAG